MREKTDILGLLPLGIVEELDYALLSLSPISLITL
jgi:hypothetical protein